MQTMNVLLPGFHENLYETYHGPPYSQDYPFCGKVRTEEGLCRAVRECTPMLIKFIHNPSDKVLMAHLDRPCSHIEGIPNPSKPVIRYYILKHGYHIKKYRDMFNEKELLEMIDANPTIFESLSDPTYDICMKAVQKDFSYLRYVSKQLQSLEMCKLVAKNMKEISNAQRVYTKFDFSKQFDKNRYKDLIFVIYFAHFDSRIVDDIIETKFVLDIENIPQQYMTGNKIVAALLTNPMRLKCILKTDHLYNEFMKLSVQDILEQLFEIDRNVFIHIPQNLQTEKMLQKIKDDKLYFLLPYAKRFEDVFYVQVFNDSVSDVKYVPHNDQIEALHCEQEISNGPCNIRYIPFDKQTLKMCEEAVRKNYHNLEYCAKFNSDIAMIIFKSERLRNVPRKDRFDFINSYNNETLLRLVKQCPMLIKSIDKHHLTDALIETVLNIDGFMLQYIDNQRPEWVKIALENEPRAIRFVKIKIPDIKNETKEDLHDESKDDIEDKYEDSLKNESKDDLTNENKNDLVNESKNDLVNENKNDLLNESKNDLVNESKDDLSNENKNDLISESKDDLEDDCEKS